MSTDTQEEQRPPTQKEVEEQKHRQAMHKVFGRDKASRTLHQQHVVEWLERIVASPTFLRGRDGRFDNTSAAINEGQRLFANQILQDLKTDPVAITQKPTVKKQ